MIAALVLPLADFKTITVDSHSGPTAQTVTTAEIAWALALLVLVLVVLLLPRLWRSIRPRSSPVPENWILVDGSNVMHWQDNTPQLEPVKLVIAQLRRLGYVPGVVFDANAGWKLAGRYLHDGDFARLLGLEARQVLVVPKGTQADPFLLQTAREFGARIVTNDRFRDWAAQHPEVADPTFLIRGGFRGPDLWLKGLDPATPAPADA